LVFAGINGKPQQLHFYFSEYLPIYSANQPSGSGSICKRSYLANHSDCFVISIIRNRIIMVSWSSFPVGNASIWKKIIAQRDFISKALR
jgi:hypothetical protein